jgi:hypothetical protein
MREVSKNAKEETNTKKEEGKGKMERKRPGVQKDRRRQDREGGKPGIPNVEAKNPKQETKDSKRRGQIFQGRDRHFKGGIPTCGEGTARSEEWESGRTGKWNRL